LEDIIKKSKTAKAFTVLKFIKRIHKINRYSNIGYKVRIQVKK